MTAVVDDAERRGFIHGIAYAAAWISTTRGEPYEAAIFIGESGLSLKAFRAAKTPGVDMREISRLFRTEPSLKRSRT